MSAGGRDEERRKLADIIHHWNANRLDLFEISQPTVVSALPLPAPPLPLRGAPRAAPPCRRRPRGNPPTDPAPGAELRAPGPRGPRGGERARRGHLCGAGPGSRARSEARGGVAGRTRGSRAGGGAGGRGVAGGERGLWPRVERRLGGGRGGGVAVRAWGRGPGRGLRREAVRWEAGVT